MIMGVFVKYGPQNEAQKQHAENVANYQSQGTNKSYYDSLFMGTPYESQYQAILRKYSSNQPPESLWGLLTGQNSLNEYNHNMSLMDELESLATKVYDEEFQSPLSDVARQRAAGLNPDLNGLTSQSAADRQSGGIPSVGSANPLEVMSNTLSTVMSIYSTIKGFKGINLQNEKMELSNLESMKNFVQPLLIDSYAHQFKTGETRAVFNPFSSNKKMSKLFDQALYTLQSNGSFQTAQKAYERLFGIENNRWQYGSFVGNSHWSPDDRALFHYVGGMMEMSLASTFGKQKYDYDYYRNSDGTLRAETEIGEYNSRKYLNRIRTKTYKMLEHDFDNGSILAGLLCIDGFPSILSAGINSVGTMTNGFFNGRRNVKK